MVFFISIFKIWKDNIKEKKKMSRKYIKEMVFRGGTKENPFVLRGTLFESRGNCLVEGSDGKIYSPIGWEEVNDKRKDENKGRI